VGFYSKPGPSTASAGGGGGVGRYLGSGDKKAATTLPRLAGEAATVAQGPSAQAVDGKKKAVPGKTVFGNFSGW
jgi:hypothetical protein